MRIAYIVLCHTNPAQVVRLADRLAVDGDEVWLHVDARHFSMRGALEALFAGNPAVHVLPSIPVFWGDWTVVEAALAGLYAVAHAPDPFDYTFLLSGQDYPIVSATELRAQLEAASGRSLVAHGRLADADWHDRDARLRGYGLPNPLVEPGVHQGAREKLLPDLDRPLPRGIEPYGGSAWWALSRKHVELVLDSLSSRADIAAFYRWADIPDEMFFQTVLANADPEGLVDRSITYTDWTRVPAPATLVADDLLDIVESGCLFARKFDVNADAAILDLLDAHAGL